MQNLFIITSAVNTRFGAFSKEVRLSQTLATIHSVQTRAPNSKIVIFESSGVPLDEETLKVLQDNSDELINFSNEENVQGIYNATDSWDIVKNLCELMCFHNGLKTLRTHDIMSDVDRIFKLSGRYQLNENFDTSAYDPRMIVTTKKYNSQFPLDLVGVEFQRMSRLWSWPKTLNERVIVFYNTAVKEMREKLSEGKYIDIEHLLYKHLPDYLVQEIQPIGVEGNLGPSGVLVKD
jgi:hypothetical protein